MDWRTDLLNQIDAWVGRSGISESYFGFLAVNDGKFVARIRGGGSALPETIQRCRAFMAENEPGGFRDRKARILNLAG